MSSGDFRDLWPAKNRPDRAQIELLIKIVPLVFLATIIALVVWRGTYRVEPHQEAAVLRFGKFQQTTGPGLHFMVPFVDEAFLIDEEEKSFRLPFDRSMRQGSNQTRSSRDEVDSLMLTGDLNAATVEWTVNWRVTDPQKHFTSIQIEQFDQVLRIGAQSVMHRLVGDYSIDEIRTQKRTELSRVALAETQALIDVYDSGVTITELQVQRVTPPRRVQAAFDSVNTAIQRREGLVNEARRERFEKIPLAESVADKSIQEANGDADQMRAEAEGEIAALKAKAAAYHASRDVTRLRLYLEAMEEVLAGSGEKTIIDADLKGLLPLLNLGDNGNISSGISK